MIGDLQRQRLQLVLQPGPFVGKDLRDVAHPRAEGGRLLFSLQVYPVLLQLSAAAAAVGDHEVQVIGPEKVSVEAGRLLDAGQVVAEHVGRAAALLRLRGDHPVAERGEEPYGGEARLAEDQAHHAAEKEADRPFLLSYSRSHLLQGLAQRFAGEGRQEPLHPAKGRREHLQKPKRADHLLHAGCLVETKRRGGCLQAVRVRHELSEDQLLHHGESLLLLLLAAELGHQLPGIHPAGAGRGAGLAVEAKGDVFQELLAIHQLSLLELAHQRHAPARRGGLQKAFLIGRAVRQAHAAAHAVDQL